MLLYEEHLSSSTYSAVTFQPLTQRKPLLKGKLFVLVLSFKDKCRSVMMVAVLNHYFHQRGIKVIIKSAATMKVTIPKEEMDAKARAAHRKALRAIDGRKPAKLTLDAIRDYGLQAPKNHTSCRAKVRFKRDKCLEQCDIFVCTDSEKKRIIIADFGVPADKIIVLNKDKNGQPEVDGIPCPELFGEKKDHDEVIRDIDTHIRKELPRFLKRRKK